nr:3-hydroxyacyl-CoA dehydrogenase family protein [Bradyrhizobium genosp. SA-3]
MYPLVVRKEIHGFIANRLQTAAWREALWLVHDGLATVQEIDDAVRFSFGLRRPVPGPILTYFVGSGETSMRAEKWGPGARSLRGWKPCQSTRSRAVVVRTCDR